MANITLHKSNKNFKIPRNQLKYRNVIMGQDHKFYKYVKTVTINGKMPNCWSGKLKNIKILTFHSEISIKF